MDCQIKTIAEAVQLAANIVTSLSLLGLVFTYILSKKQIHFSVMEKCVKDFREFDKSEKGTVDSVKLYIDLVNEELFYTENSYLPFDVAVEWLDGMIDYLPFISNRTVCNAECASQIIFTEISYEKIMVRLGSYPRVKKMITIEGKLEIDFRNIYSDDIITSSKERTKLLTSMVASLDLGLLDRWRMRRAIVTR